MKYAFFDSLDEMNGICIPKIKYPIWEATIWVLWGDLFEKK